MSPAHRRLGAILMSLALGGAACTTVTTTSTTSRATPDPPDTTTTTSTTTTVPGQELRGGRTIVGLAAEPTTLNPLLASPHDEAARLIAQAWNVGAFDIAGDTGETVPGVVAEIPTVTNGGVVLNDDGTMTVTYLIRDEARWSDGVPITGADFQFTLETILEPDLPISSDVYRDITGTEVDEKTFRYTLAAPDIRYERLFDTLLPEHDVQGSDFAEDWNDTTWVGGGPFVFDEWEPGVAVRFTRNEEYREIDAATGALLPYLDAVEFRTMPDPFDRLGSLVGRELSVIQGATDFPSLRARERLADLGATVVSANGPLWLHLNFQFGPRRLERNADSLNAYDAFRRAILHAVDRERLIEELHGGIIDPLDSYVEAFRPGLSQHLWNRYPYDPETAAALLAEATEVAEPEAARVVLATNAQNADRVRIMELLSVMLAAVGISTSLQLESDTVFFSETVPQGRWDTGMWAWTGSSGYAGLVAFHEAFDPGDALPPVRNYYRWGTEDSDVRNASTDRYGALLQEMRSTVDVAELEALIAEAEQIIADGAVILPLFAAPVTAAFWPDEIQGFVMSGLQPGFTWNIERWRRPE
jgi:ABC-type transport system substrate-binding protein